MAAGEFDVMVGLVSVFIGSTWMSLWVCDVLPYKEYWLGGIGMRKLVVLHVFIVGVCYCFYKSISAPAGGVPRGWTPPNATEEEMKHAKEQAKLRKRPPQTPEVRWCLKCNNFKPLRTFHCSDCNKCTLKMDHHCPWVNNCVGFGNHKYFCCFVFSAAIACSWILEIHLSTIVSVVLDNENEHHKTVSFGPFEAIIIILDTLILFPVTFGLISLLSWQLSLVLVNCTTIEHRELCWAKMQQGGEIFLWKYDQGRYDNICSVFGNNIFQWFIPSGPPPGENGFDFFHHKTVVKRENPKTTEKKIVIEIDSDDGYEGGTVVKKR